MAGESGYSKAAVSADSMEKQRRKEAEEHETDRERTAREVYNKLPKISYHKSCSRVVNTIFKANLTATGLSTKSREKTGRELQTEGPIQQTTSSVSSFITRQRS